MTRLESLPFGARLVPGDAERRSTHRGVRLHAKAQPRMSPHQLVRDIADAFLGGAPTVSCEPWRAGLRSRHAERPGDDLGERSGSQVLVPREGQRTGDVAVCPGAVHRC